MSVVKNIGTIGVCIAGPIGLLIGSKIGLIGMGICGSLTAIAGGITVVYILCTKLYIRKNKNEFIFSFI
jgi:uncharacterized membrane protein YeiH